MNPLGVGHRGADELDPERIAVSIDASDHLVEGAAWLRSEKADVVCHDLIDPPHSGSSCFKRLASADASEATSGTSRHRTRPAGPTAATSQQRCSTSAGCHRRGRIHADVHRAQLGHRVQLGRGWAMSALITARMSVSRGQGPASPRVLPFVTGGRSRSPGTSPEDPANDLPGTGRVDGASTGSG